MSTPPDDTQIVEPNRWALPPEQVLRLQEEYLQDGTHHKQQAAQTWVMRMARLADLAALLELDASSGVIFIRLYAPHPLSPKSITPVGWRLLTERVRYDFGGDAFRAAEEEGDALELAFVHARQRVREAAGA